MEDYAAAESMRKEHAKDQILFHIPFTMVLYTALAIYTHYCSSCDGVEETSKILMTALTVHFVGLPLGFASAWYVPYLSRKYEALARWLRAAFRTERAASDETGNFDEEKGRDHGAIKEAPVSSRQTKAAACSTGNTACFRCASQYPHPFFCTNENEPTGSEHPNKTTSNEVISETG